MHELSSSNSSYQFAAPDLPPCCGTGCAVCVLDLVDDDTPPVQEKPADSIANAPICCNTGCLVCVNDHPELFCDQRLDAQTIELLEAMEAAERVLQ